MKKDNNKKEKKREEIQLNAVNSGKRIKATCLICVGSLVEIS